MNQPVSPANEPESTTRSIDCQNASNGPSFLSSPFTPVRRKMVSTRVVTKMIASVSNPSQPMTTDGPFESAVSKR